MPVNIFTPNIPLKPQSLGFTQPLVLGNFANYRENMEKNHEDINSADFGKHKYLTLTNQSSVPVTGATEGGLYSTLINTRAVNFLQRESNAAELGITIYPGGTAGATSDYVAFTTIFDFNLIADAAHPNFWAVMEIRDYNVTTLQYGQFAISGFLLVKCFTDQALGSKLFTLVPLGPQITVGGTASYQMGGTGNELQLKMTPPLPNALTWKATFTISTFYFPYA